MILRSESPMIELYLVPAGKTRSENWERRDRMNQNDIAAVQETEAAADAAQALAEKQAAELRADGAAKAAAVCEDAVQAAKAAGEKQLAEAAQNAQRRMEKAKAEAEQEGETLQQLARKNWDTTIDAILAALV